MSNYTLRTAKFKEKLCGEVFDTVVKLCKRDKIVKDYLLAPQGTFWIEIAGWKSSLFNTKAEADYAFESKCLDFFIKEELFKMPNRKSNDELRDLFPYFAYRKGQFEYFHPETRDFRYYVIIYLGHFEDDSKIISKAIGKPISFPDLPDSLYNALIWEIKPNSANLYKIIVAEDNRMERSNLGITIEGDKELLYTYPNYKDLLMSCISINSASSLSPKRYWIID